MFFKLDTKINKKVKDLFLPYKMLILCSIFCTLAISIVSILIPMLMKKLTDNGLLVLNLNLIIRYVLFIILALIIRQAFDFIQSLIHIKIENTMLVDLSVESIKKLLRIKIEYFHEGNFSKIIQSLSFNIDNIVLLANRSFLSLFMQIFNIIGGLIGLFFISFKLTIFTLLFIPIKILIMNTLTKINEKKFKKMIMIVNKIGFWHGDILNGIEQIKFWNLYSKKEREFTDLINTRVKLKSGIDTLNSFNDFLGELVGSTITNSIYILGAFMIINKELTIGGLLSFIMYSSLVINPISALISIKYRLSNIIPALDSYLEFMDLEEEEENKKISIEPKSLQLNTIRFKDVCLRYKDKDTIKDINLTFNRGEKIAFIGRNGSGKTSLMNILLRLYKPTSGSIYIDNVNIEKIDLFNYRELFAIMNQNVFLFNKSIKENIDLLDKMSEEKLLELCRKENIEKFIEFALTKQEKFNMNVGFTGSRLSGGEKQRVAIVRTILKENSKILILDEATSNFDIESEKIFNEMVERSNKYDFTFIITHRTDILKNMDKIIVLENGIVKSIGIYEELMSKGLIPKEIINYRVEEAVR
ncbi:ABC transporter ATP-binding protein [uncultured Clostridium sp.]|uniref:ABC transporter ATP-binding protein n=1 Tax=uncultured Clostridium sp. TaxID=59620 RepID=UPI0028E6089D|nr:ABC transporter ATP-binding protein [uncultured Clostridium sp.]